ncbi:hypothetical protein [Kribbella sp. CA-294648]|uniref:hypothetical protein n=1 Tax=Kribbella sp. CA-294648 TaxID=3239948 RepID=UPI003D8AB113
MRKTPLVAAAAAFAIVGTLTQVPAWATGPETPTELQIGWSATPGKIQVRWKDGGLANRIRVQYQSTSNTTELATTAAGDADEVLVDRHDYGLHAFEVLRITVVTIDAAGVESAPADSPWFDAIRPPQPQLIDAGPANDLSLLTVWQTPAVPEDTTPNDPLDRPASESVIGPELWYGWGSSNPVEAFWHPMGTTSAFVPPRPRPYPVKVASRSEWGQPRSEGWIVFGVMNVGIKLPATAVYGKPMTVGGTAGITDCITGTAPCVPHTGANGIPVTLQTRADATKPWAYAGRYLAQNGPIQGVTTPVGTRQYRFYIPIQKDFTPGATLDGGTVTSPASSSVRTVTTYADFVTAKFDKSVASVGETVTASVDVRPAGTSRAALQYFDGSVWRHSMDIALVNGKGTVSFKASGRGTTKNWRITVPAMTYNGLPIAATVSRTFPLSVR